jgi:hypothetical protein
MAKAAAFLVGLALVALALIGWRVPPGDGVLGADVTLFALEHDGALDVSPAGRFGGARGLTRGDRVEGRLSVRNRSRRPVRIRLRAPADRSGLDRLLYVEAAVDDRVLYRGRLSGLRRWTMRSFRLAPGAHEDLRLRAHLRGDAGGRFATLNLELRPAS